MAQRRSFFLRQTKRKHTKHDGNVTSEWMNWNYDCDGWQERKKAITEDEEKERKMNAKICSYYDGFPDNNRLNGKTNSDRWYTNEILRRFVFIRNRAQFLSSFARTVYYSDGKWARAFYAIAIQMRISKPIIGLNRLKMSKRKLIFVALWCARAIC